MQLTNAEAKEALGALQVLASEKHPKQGALHMRKLIRALTVHNEDVEAERIRIIEEYVERDEHGNPVTGDQPGTIKLDMTRLADAQRELAELWAATWESDCRRIRATDLADDVQPALLVRLGDLVEDEE